MKKKKKDKPIKKEEIKLVKKEESKTVKEEIKKGLTKITANIKKVDYAMNLSNTTQVDKVLCVLYGLTYKYF